MFGSAWTWWRVLSFSTLLLAVIMGMWIGLVVFEFLVLGRPPELVLTYAGGYIMVAMVIITVIIGSVVCEIVRTQENSHVGRQHLRGAAITLVLLGLAFWAVVRLSDLPGIDILAPVSTVTVFSLRTQPMFEFRPANSIRMLTIWRYTEPLGGFRFDDKSKVEKG